MLRVELAKQPRARHRPLGLHCSRRDREHFRCLLYRQPGEIAQLHDTRVTRTALGKPAQGFFEIHELGGVSIDISLIVVESYKLRLFTALDRKSSPGAIHEHLAHRIADSGKKVRAAALRHSRVVREPEINLVNQRGRLKRILSLFIAESAMRDRSELIVDQRDELV